MFKLVATVLGWMLLRVVLFFAIFAMVGLAFKLAVAAGSMWLLFLPVIVLFLVSDYLLERHHLKRPLWSDYWWRFRR